MMSKNSEAVLNQKTLVARNLRVHGFRYTPFHKEKEIIPNKEQLENIRLYLKNPTHHGIWKLGINWNEKDDISNDIQKLILGQKQHERFEYGSNRLGSLPVPSLIFIFFRLLIEGVKSDYADYYSYQLFRILNNSESKKGKENLEKFKEKYKEAFKYFKDNIYCKNFDVIIDTNGPLSIQDGIYFIEDTEESNLGINKINYDSVFVSIDRSPLEKIEIFLGLIGKVSESKLVTIFSPEEEVFSAYINLLIFSSKFLFRDESLVDRIKKATNEYNDKNFEHVISIIGLATEGLFVEIYETYFRNSAPKRCTLNQLYKLIHDSINRSLKLNPKSSICDEIHKRLNGLKNVPESKITKKELIKIIQQIMGALDQNRKYVDFKIRSLRDLDVRHSVFPSALRENINELIFNRNKVAHKSRVPVDPYDSVRTIYCYITLVMWWNDEKEEINKAPLELEEVLNESIKRNSDSDTLEIQKEDK